MNEATVSEIPGGGFNDSGESLPFEDWDTLESTLSTDPYTALDQVYTELRMINRVQMYIFAFLVFFAIFGLMNFFIKIVQDNVTRHF